MSSKLPENDLETSENDRRLRIALTCLLAMIVGLMGLGAGVRAMHAGLACPDWPLCFGKVIPDFQVGVYFEFVHRVYAGAVSLLFIACLIAALRSKTAPVAAKRFGLAALVILCAQIVMGGLTVLQLLKIVVVTAHLMLATLFFSCVLGMFLILRASAARLAGNATATDLSLRQSHGCGGGHDLRSSQPPRVPFAFRSVLVAYPVAVLAQIALGGLVAASYAGLVCVDFPLCNGELAPTFRGAIGLQVLHRFGAYFVVAGAVAIAIYARAMSERDWSTPSLRRAAGFLALAALAQLGVGILNVILYIPPVMTVLHQSMAILTLTCAYRLAVAAGESGWRSGPAVANSSRSKQVL